MSTGVADEDQETDAEEELGYADGVERSGIRENGHGGEE